MLSCEILEYLTSDSEHLVSKKFPERNLISEVWFEKLQLFFMFQHYIKPSVVSWSVCATQEFRDYDTAQLLIQN